MFLAVVSKAFTVLSDPDKRAVYDMNPGFDPESRGGGGGGGGGGGPSPFSNMSRGFPRGGRGGMEQDITPEDLFNMFFGGGGMGNGGFGGGGPSEWKLIPRRKLHALSKNRKR